MRVHLKASVKAKKQSALHCHSHANRDLLAAMASCSVELLLSEGLYGGPHFLLTLTLQDIYIRFIALNNEAYKVSKAPDAAVRCCLCPVLII